MERLSEPSSSVNSKNTTGHSPLHYEITEMLLRRGALADIRDDEGRYPVQNVVEKRNIDGLAYLLRHGADFDNVISPLPFTNRLLDWRSVRARSIDRYVNEYLIKLTEIGFGRRAYLAYCISTCVYVVTYSERVKGIKEEAALLKQFFIEDKVSAYDVIHMSYRRRATYCTKLPADLDQKLPIFRSVIRGRCRRASDRVKLMRQANPAWDSITGINWPDICTEMIFSYLTIADIAALVLGEQKMRYRAALRLKKT